jgi:hypothetical protein
MRKLKTIGDCLKVFGDGDIIEQATIENLRRRRK